MTDILVVKKEVSKCEHEKITAASPTHTQTHTKPVQLPQSDHHKISQDTCCRAFLYELLLWVNTDLKHHVKKITRFLWK